MERTKNIQGKKPRWRKVGGGSLRMGNRIIKPGQIFEALPEEISSPIRKFVIPISGDASFKETEKKETVVIPGVAPKYTVKKKEFTMEQKGKSKLWFNVLDGDGEVVNEKSLKKEDAQALIDENVSYDVVDEKGKTLNDKSLEKEVAEKLVEDLLK